MTRPTILFAMVLVTSLGSTTRARAHEPGAVARELVFRARVDGAQVVRPEAFQPPVLGSGSEAMGEATLFIINTTGEFRFELDVSGVDPTVLDSTHGPNATAIHIHSGDPMSRGPIIIDAHHFARDTAPDTNGVTATADGFTLRAEGVVNPEQGELDTGLSLPRVIDFLRTGEAYIAVHTTTNPLFRTGELRGNLRLVPEKLRLETTVDGAQVVRPPAFQPPVFGSGSDASGTGSLQLDTRTGYFRFDLAVDGLDPALLDSSHGPNLTPIHLHSGGPDERGPIVLDVVHFSRDTTYPANGIVATSTGFRLHAEGELTREQGGLDSELELLDVVDLLQDERVYIAVHTTSNPLFRTGELRGNLAVVPRVAHFRARLDEGQVVRPVDLQPPALGTGSKATGDMEMAIDLDDGAFVFDLDVDGIDPATLDDASGVNQTAVQVRFGHPRTVGPILVDVHHFARQLEPESNGVIVTESGFRMHAEGHVSTVQGDHNTLFSMESLLGFLRTESVYVSVHTSTSDLFRGGEIRGNIDALPQRSERLTFEARLDGEQIIRPLQFQPPARGSGSEATGRLVLEVDPETDVFTLELDVRGISPDVLDATHGPNSTALHIHRAAPNANGPIIIDVHHYARQNGIVEATEDGFRLAVTDLLSDVQGFLDVGNRAYDIIEALLSDDAYIAVHTTTNVLFRTGELRGNISLRREREFSRGDCDGDGNFDGLVTDAVFLLGFNLLGTEAPPCLAACDANADGETRGVTDAIYMLRYNFLGFAPPPMPFPNCGAGAFPGDAELGCNEQHEGCAN